MAFGEAHQHGSVGVNSYNTLLAAFDQAIGFPNKRDSRWKKTFQGFDQKTGEHVFVIQYRTRVNPGVSKPQKIVHRRGSLPVIRELLMNNGLGSGETCP